MHFVPSGGISSRQIKAPRAVLLDCGYFRQEGVKFSVMAENYPTFRSYFADPLVIRRLVIEPEFVSRVVVILHREINRLRRSDRLRETPTEIAIKVQG
jgi:hypothetical protein